MLDKPHKTQSGDATALTRQGIDAAGLSPTGRCRPGELRGRAGIVLACLLAIALIGTSGCEKRPCLRQQCDNEIIVMQQVGQSIVPIYGEVCRCVEYGAAPDGGAAR